MGAVKVDRPPHVPEDRVVDFDIYNPPGAERDFHGAWKALQDSGVPDLVWSPYNGGHWLGTRFKIVGELFATHELFSNRVEMVPKSEGEQLQMIPHGVDPPDHRAYRVRLNASLAPKTIGRIEGRIRDLAINLIDRVRLDGACNFTTSYAQVLPVEIFMSLMDLPREDAPMLRAWADKILRPDPSMTIPQAVGKFHEYLGGWVDQRFGKDGSDILSRMINGSVAGRELTKSEAVRIATLVLFAGLDTVVGAMGFAMLFMARNPSHRRELIADPSLIPAAVEELLRRFPIVVNAREVRQDVIFAGVQLKKGDMVVAPSHLAGLDDQANDDPMRVDFHRDATEHLTFGLGPHRCAGAHLARTELRITLEEWLARIPEFEVQPGFEITYTAGVAGLVDSLPLIWDPARTRNPDR